MQYSMHNQCNDLFTCIINYLHILCTILMVLSCILCIIFIVFIYMYYGLFTCINLVDTMSLFFTIFLFHLLNFTKIGMFPTKTVRNSPRRFSDKSADLSVKPVVFWCFRFSVFLHHLQYISTEFFYFLPIF
jgi:hypothetical protein